MFKIKIKEKIFIIIYYVFLFLNQIEIKTENNSANILYLWIIVPLLLSLPCIIISVQNYYRLRQDIHFYFKSNAQLLLYLKRHSTQITEQYKNNEEYSEFINETTDYLIRETQNIAKKYNFTYLN
ncbi:MAG: hypothetical protein WCK67_07990 [bacterium]